MQNILFRMEVENLSTKENSSDNVAVNYLGIALIIAIVVFGLYAIVTQGYNANVSVSHEKIEVQATNSNSQNNTVNE